INESTQLSEQAVKHFADLASFHNTQVEDASAAWQSAIRGQYEPIQKFFPFITDSYLKTYGVANGMIDENTKNLTANQRAIILNAIALDEQLNPALNDFSETSDGLANQTRIMKAEWNNALITLGQNLLPIALKVVQAFNQLLESFNKLSPTQQKILLVFMGLVAIAGPLLSALGTIVTIISSLIGFAGTLSEMGITLGTIGTVITETLVPAIAAILTALAPILIILAAVAFYIGLLYVVWRTNFLGMGDAINAFVSVVQSLWQALMAFLRGDTDAALGHLRAAWETFVQNTIAQNARMQAMMQTLVTGMTNAARNMVTGIQQAFNVNWAELATRIIGALVNGLQSGASAVINAARNIALSAMNAARSVFGSGLAPTGNQSAGRVAQAIQPVTMQSGAFSGATAGGGSVN
ncbi:MAG: hypothetical protein L0287_26295, partial [Anaerolineae bacterium]|nr:hypothetical protein [Anaerolineae bacterium]